MREYIKDDFYKLPNKNISIKKEILIDAHSKSYKWWVDILDCNISWFRQRIEMSLDEILLKLGNNSHFVFIHRKGYKPQNQDDINDIWRYKLEIGFRAMNSPDYFLWVHVEQEHLQYFIDKYNLKINE